MDKVSLSLIIDKLDALSLALYNERINKVQASFDLDEVIDELKSWLDYLPLSPSDN